MGPTQLYGLNPSQFGQCLPNRLYSKGTRPDPTQTVWSGSAPVQRRNSREIILHCSHAKQWRRERSRRRGGRREGEDNLGCGSIAARGDHFRFGSVFIKKSNQNRFKPIGFGSVRLFWGKNRFKPVWLGFYRLDSVFLQFGLVFFLFGFGSVFRFQAYKTKPNRSVSLKI